MSERDPGGAGANSEGVALSSSVEGAVFFQSYGPQPEIEGVSVQPLRKHQGENGWFAELYRLRENGEVEGMDEALQLRQLSASWAEAGRINAFHIHPRVRQDEVWIVIQGRLIVWLVDCRAGSRTEGTRRKVILSGDAPARLIIPSGVAHGYRAGEGGALLIYGMNQQFSSETPNEGRLPWDWFGEDLWEEDRG